MAALSAVPPAAELQALWLELESRAHASVFLSWHWIGTWLECLPDDVERRLLRVQRGGRLAGLAILVRRTLWRHGFVRSRALYLNCSGDPRLDEITIEHNGILCEKGLEEEVTRAALRRLLEEEGDWDEFFLDGIGRPQAVAGAPLHPAGLRERFSSPSHYVDLAALAAHGGDYVAGLGRRTRYQLRRSMREYEKHGPLVVDEARDAATARTFLRGLEGYHQRHWTRRGKPGSFANRFFVGFHERLLERCFDAGVIQLLRLTAGGHELGYLYNHVHRGHVYVYQTGFNYAGQGPYDRPGVVSHVLAIEHNLARRNAVYDFSAGDSEYKRVLSNASAPLSWLVIQRPRLRFRLEDGLRALRRRLRGPAGAGPVVDSDERDATMAADARKA